MIEKLTDDQSYLADVRSGDIRAKINELIEAINGSKERVLRCPYCDSEEWENRYSSTAMRGSRNYYNYTCKKCGELTTVLKIKCPATDARVYLGTEDEIQGHENK